MKTLLITLMLLVSSALSQDTLLEDLKPWEKLGISSKEYHECQLREFPEDSIKLILSYGINPIQFFKKPWVSINITLIEWMGYRKAGLTDQEIYLKLNPVLQPVNVQSKLKIEWSNAEQKKEYSVKLQSLLLPGYVQITSCPYKPQKITGIVMVSLAAVAIGSTIGWSVHEEYLMCYPMIGIMIPNMFWSYFNCKKWGMF